MRKILSTLMLLLTVAFLSKGQDVKPVDPINFKTLQSPSWSYMALDSAIWIYKGSTYGWTKIHGDTHLKRYYVPYDNALRNVDLGDKKITSTKQRLPLFNGACVVPTITDNGNGSITVSNGEYHLSTNTEGRGTENFLINGGTFTLTDQTQNYLVADYNSGTPILKVITDVNLINETTVIPIYTAYRNGIFLHFQNWDALGLALANKVHQSIVKTQRYRREYGLIVTEYGTHNLNMTAGRVWVGAVPVDIAEINTGVDNLSIWYHSGGNWVNSIQPTYNFTQWDNGTDLVTLTNNRHAVNWIFRGIENQKHLYIVLGRGDYSLVEAEASSMPPIPTAISSHAVLAARLIVEKNAATATNIKSAFDIQFSLASVQKHDDLTGRDVVNSHPASAISNTPAGNISSTNVQAAINELDTEKVAKVSSTDNAIARFDGTGGNIQNSGAYLFDSGNFYVGSNTENSYSRMLVYGGTNGANLDIRGEAGTFTDQATIEVMGNDYDTTTRSAYLQYKGSTHTGTTLGYSNANLSQLVMNGDNNLIYSSLAKPIIFGTNNQRSGMIDIDGKLVLDSLASASSSIVTASTAGKLNKATFTTTGNSGAATFSLNNLNIPNYTLAGLGAGTAANNNTGDFILNQNSLVQSASARISGKLIIGELPSYGRISVAQDITELNTHSFDDYSILNPSVSGLGYGTFDASTKLNGNRTNNHLIAYQSRLTHNSSGQLDGDYGLSGMLIANSITLGQVIFNHGIYIDKPIISSGAVQNNYGLRIKDQNIATLSNYAIYTGLGEVRFGDNVNATKRVFSTSTASQMNAFKAGGLIARDAVSEEKYLQIGFVDDYGYLQAIHEGVEYKNLILNANSASGRVGICNTNPQAALDVTGDGIFSATLNSTGYLKDSTPLLLDWLKSGSAPASGNIVVGNGTTSNPSGVSVNQAIGGGLMQENYMQYWDGSKLVNGIAVTDGSKIALGAITLQERLNVAGNIKMESEAPYTEYRNSNWASSSYIQAGVNFNGTALGDYFSIIIPSGKNISFATAASPNSLVEFLSSGAIKTSSLSGSGTRLVSATSDGTLSNITNGTEGQVLKIVSGVPQFNNESGGIADAPTDGLYYLRKDNAWDQTNAVTRSFSAYSLTLPSSRIIDELSGAMRIRNASYTNASFNSDGTTSFLYNITGVTASFSGMITADNFKLGSDRRIKQGIKPIKNIDFADKIKFVSYFMKSDTTRMRYGVIAQDVEKINPSFVYTDDKGMKSVDYIGILVSKVEALQRKVNELESDMKNVKRKIKRHAK